MNYCKEEYKPYTFEVLELTAFVINYEWPLAFRWMLEQKLYVNLEMKIKFTLENKCRQ